MLDITTPNLILPTEFVCLGVVTFHKGYKDLVVDVPVDDPSVSLVPHEASSLDRLHALQDDTNHGMHVGVSTKTLTLSE